MSPKPLAEKYLLGAPCQFVGPGFQRRGGHRAGGIAGQALEMGSRVILRQHRTEHGTLDGDFWNIRV